MSKSKLKVMTIVGTRPEIIRLSRVMSLFEEKLDHVLVHTGQNYDYELNEVFFQDLGLKKPDYFLEVDTSSLGATIGDIFRKVEPVIREVMPDAFLVLGDTNSCLAAYMAKRLKVPVFHMEAGNRSFDFNVPEELNRRVIDHIADFNLVYTEHARRHLISEGLPHRRIYLTGSPMKEVLDYYMPKIEESSILNKLELEKKSYFVASFHRQENVDNPENLRKIVSVINTLAEEHKVPVIVSTHPRTRKRLEQSGFEESKGEIRYLKPFGFTDYINLQMNARCTISDSGTISEESAMLSFPAISLRQSMERPEAQDAGTIILTGFEPQRVLDAVNMVIEEHAEQSYQQIPNDYQISNTSWRVLKLVQGNAGLSNLWHGINPD